jgi:phosphotransferase system enzyme I (PtsP)
MGYDTLSMNSISLPKVKKALRSVLLDDARNLLEEVVTMDHSEQIQGALGAFLSERGMQQFVPVSLDEAVGPIS